jgi:hypothetical protein
MTTAAAQRQTLTGAPNDASSEDTVLDRRRDDWQAAQQTAAAVQARVADLNKTLDTNATQRTEHETALQAALDRQAELKTAIKASAKERERLRAARKQADSDADTARHRAQDAEAKYDQALLAEMLRQQKDTDLSTHDGAAKPTATRTADHPATTATRRRSTPTSRKPRDTTESSTVAQSTARRTAATATARKLAAEQKPPVGTTAKLWRAN